MRWTIVTVAVGAVIAGSVWYFKRNHTDAPEYQTTQVTRGDLTQVVTATGTLNPVVNVTVGSQVSGRISKLYVDFNSIVKSNEVIAEIDPSTYQAAVEQCTADLANAKANLELQQVQAKRSSDLFKNNLISGSDYDTAVANLHEAEATVKIKQASLDNANANLGYCKILSPVDGIVISRTIDLGQTVASSFSTPTLFQIANDLTKMQIDTSVAEADVGGVVEGQSVDFTVDAYPYRIFYGTVVQVRNAPTNSSNVVSYDCVVSVTNSDYKLKPGMTANLSFTIAQRENALTIPNGALRFHPPENAVVLTNSAAAQTAPATNSGNFAGDVRRAGPSRRPRARRASGFPYRLCACGQRQGCEAAGTADQDRHQRRHLDRGAFGAGRGRAGCDRRGFNRHPGRPDNEPIGRRLPQNALIRFAVQTNPVIKLADIHKVYHTGEVDVHAVRGISLEVFPGEFVALMGASGSGKSTLMNMIGALDRPTGGHYWLDGIDVSTLDRDALADVRNEKIGFVFQGFNLLSRTSALENVEMPMLYHRHRIQAHEQRERALGALDLVGLGDRADHHPNQLSGGQQQRVAIARALVNRPTLLLADEPTGNLDTQTSIEIMGVFQKLNDQGITIVMVTHELDVARFTRRMVVLRDGQIVTDEPVQNRSFAEKESQQLRVAQQAVKLAS